MQSLDGTLTRRSVVICPLTNTDYDERKQTKQMRQDVQGGLSLSRLACKLCTARQLSSVQSVTSRQNLGQKDFPALQLASHHIFASSVQSRVHFEL